MFRTRRIRAVIHWFAAASLATALHFCGATSPSAQSISADEITLRIIVIESLDDARQALEQLRAGGDFAALAKQVSIEPSAGRGGLLGRVTISALRPELRAALEGVKTGELSPIVQIPTGFAILSVVPDGDTDPASDLSRGLAARGSVKYVADVAGYGEALLLLREFAKPADWELDPATICRVRTESFAQGQSGLARDVASDAFLETENHFSRAQASVVLGQLYAYQGRMPQVIELFEQAHAIAESKVPSLRPRAEEALGIAHLHKAEIDNGFYSVPGDRCLLGLSPRRPLTKAADLTRSIEYFTRFLAEQPDDLEVRWLLNLGHMAAGTYPHGVPAAQLIPPSALDSAEDVGRFVDVASEAGLTSRASAGGVIVDDFDNDGRFEVVTSSFNPCERLRLFRRGNDGRFAEQGERAGLSGQVGGLNAVQADYDNDGLLDILLMRGGWEVPQRRSLLRNNGDGTFTDVTVASGLARPATSSQTAAWTDIDNDGFLDLFVGNEDQPAQLFLNNRNGTFVDIAPRAGVGRTAFTKGVAAADYDNDGWADLYVSNLGGRNFLYRNNHDRTFTEVGIAAGMPGAVQGFATWFFDYDNDGWQDLFVTSYFTSVDETVRTYLKLPNNAGTLKLYRNGGDGRFRDVTREVGLDKVFMPMGANFGDIDNDGLLDIYLGTGNPSYAALVPSVLLRNRDGRSFVDVTVSSGTGELHKGHGVAFADLDRDGDEEIVFEVGGATPGDAHLLRLFRNPGHGNDWIALKLVGVKTNRSAIGVRIALTVESGGQRRTIHRTVGIGGSFGASPLEQHIGLGRSAQIVDLQIWWPGSNTRQRFSSVEKNQVLQITELAESYARLSRPPLPLGGSSSHDATRNR